MKKTKLKWTKKLPTVDGFYWWRFNPKAVGGFRVVVECGKPVGLCLDGQWYGPIPSKEPK